MKILFLDCDGVLNSKQTFMSHQRQMDPIDDDMVKRVKSIIKETGCKIVLSSVWRNHEYSKNKVNKKIKIYDVTPNLSGFRGSEIKAWLDKHNDVTKYAILDDDSDMLPDQPLFQTSFETGLTDEIVQKVINYLNKI
jgi:hypothetical protein